MAEEKFTMRWSRGASKSTGMHFAKIGKAVRAEIKLQDMAAGSFVEPGKDGGIFHRLKPVEYTSAQQAHAFVAIGPPNDRRSFGP